MIRYLKFISVGLALPLTGCDLFYLDQVYNLTSCPIQIATSFSGRLGEGGPSRVLPGGAVVAELIRRDEASVEKIVVIDSNNVEHVYDKDLLATLRPSGSRVDNWGYTNKGLTFVNRALSDEELDPLTKQPCDRSDQSQQVQPSTDSGRPFGATN